LWVEIFNIRECISIEDEYLVDLTEAVNLQGLYCLNESIVGSAKKIFKPKDQMLERESFLESNKGDPELLIYIPFNSAVKMKSMTMIGGEGGTSPSIIKLYVNKENPDFDLIEGSVATQEFECIENPEGELPYSLKPNKFNNVFSLTLIVTRNYSADTSKIYYLGFTGLRTNKKKMVMLGNYELKPLIDGTKTKEKEINSDLIYG
jgi:hypothetical protein